MFQQALGFYALPWALLGKTELGDTLLCIQLAQQAWNRSKLKIPQFSTVNHSLIQEERKS